MEAQAISELMTPGGYGTPEQDIPEPNSRITAIFNREHEHPFEVLDSIFRLQREKTKTDLQEYEEFYKKQPKLYDPSDEETFILAMSYEDQRKKLDEDIIDRVKARKNRSSHFGGRGIGLYDNLKRNFQDMNLDKLCKDSKAFYLYKRAGAYQTPGMKDKNMISPLALKRQLEEKKLQQAIQQHKLRQLKRSDGANKSEIDKAGLNKNRRDSSTYGILAQHRRKLSYLSPRGSSMLPPQGSTALPPAGSSQFNSKESFFHTTRPRMIPNLSKVSNLTSDVPEIPGATTTTMHLPPLQTGRNDQYIEFLEQDIGGKKKVYPSFGFPGAIEEDGKVVYQDGGTQDNSTFKIPTISPSPLESRRVVHPSRSVDPSSKDLTGYQKMRRDVIKNILRRKSDKRPGRFNPQFTGPVPGAHSEEVKERVRVASQRRDESTKRVAKKLAVLENRTYESAEETGSVLASSHEENTLRAKQIIRLCNNVSPVQRLGNKDVDFQIFKEQVTANNLNNILDFLMPLENADPLTLKRFYQNKKDVDAEFKQSVEEVNLDYRLGMMDPSRDAAKAERLKCVKKNLGRKKLMMEVYERAAPK